MNQALLLGFSNFYVQENRIPKPSSQFSANSKIKRGVATRTMKTKSSTSSQIARNQQRKQEKIVKSLEIFPYFGKIAKKKSEKSSVTQAHSRVFSHPKI